MLKSKLDIIVLREIMGTQIYGIAASQNVDNVGETLMIDGIDDSRMKILSDEHGDDNGEIPFFRIVGSITYKKKIYSEKDCENDYQKRCWKVTQVPFLYIEGELADDERHPDAQSAAALIKFTQKPEIPLKLGLSIEGGILERGGEKNKKLIKTIATGAAITVKPANPACKLFLKTDLKKSLSDDPPPQRYFEALKKSQATSSVRQLAPELISLYLLQNLKKSILDFMGGFTDIQCQYCGKGERFFKSGDIPNGCRNCGQYYTMSQLWNALNKKGD